MGLAKYSVLILIDEKRNWFAEVKIISEDGYIILKKLTEKVNSCESAYRDAWEYILSNERIEELQKSQ